MVMDVMSMYQTSTTTIIIVILILMTNGNVGVNGCYCARNSVSNASTCVSTNRGSNTSDISSIDAMGLSSMISETRKYLFNGKRLEHTYYLEWLYQFVQIIAILQ